MTEGFQPGGRAPAPAPLDLVQDFVNTEIPDFNQDDIATPAALEGWLLERGLVGLDDVNPAGQPDKCDNEDHEFGPTGQAGFEIG